MDHILDLNADVSDQETRLTAAEEIIQGEIAFYKEIWSKMAYKKSVLSI